MSGTGRKIVTYYPAYALLRCSGYSANSRHAENLAICVLTAACIFAENPACSEQPGDLIDSLITAIPSYITEQRRAGNKPLLPDEKMRQLAAAINKLKAINRQVLVLYHIEMLNTKEISRIYNKSISQIRDAITDGEKELVRYIAKLWPKGQSLAQEDVCLWFDELAQTLKTEQKTRIVDVVKKYLTEPQKAGATIQEYLKTIQDLGLIG